VELELIEDDIVPKRFTNEDIINLLKENIFIDDLTFYILGGSQYNINLKGYTSEYYDIDIFFKKQGDFDLMKSRLQETISKEVYKDTLSKSTLEVEDSEGTVYNFDLRGLHLQLIGSLFGDISYQFDRFDLNKSKIGVEFRKGEVIEHVHDSFNLPLTISFKNFNIDTFNRYIKYIMRYHSNDDLDYKKDYISITNHEKYQIKKAFDYLLERKDEIIENKLYKESVGVTGIRVLQRTIYTIQRYDNIVEILLDVVQDLNILKEIMKDKEVSLVKIYKGLHHDRIFTLYRELHYKVSPEYKLKNPHLFI